MTAVNPPLAITLDSAGAQAQHPAASFRRLVELLAAGQSGVRSASDMAVAANGTPNMTTIVAAGEALVPGTEQPAAQGAYYVYNDGAVTLTHAAANGTNPRRDLVVARVYDREYSGTTGAWALEIVTGTPAASPTDPATPANSIVLARVTVRAATASILTSDITDLRPRLAFHGGRLTVTSTTRPASPTQGQEVYETDTGKVYRWTGTVWVEVGADGAWTTYTPTWTGTIGNGTITGAYTKIGRLVVFRFSITWGSTTTHPASEQRIGLPIASAEPLGPNQVNPVGSGVCQDSGVGSFPRSLTGVTSTQVRLIAEAGNVFVTNTAPFTWGSGDMLLGKGSYEAAS